MQGDFGTHSAGQGLCLQTDYFTLDKDCISKQEFQYSSFHIWVGFQLSRRQRTWVYCLLFFFFPSSGKLSLGFPIHSMACCRYCIPGLYGYILFQNNASGSFSRVQGSYFQSVAEPANIFIWLQLWTHLEREERIHPITRL